MNSVYPLSLDLHAHLRGTMSPETALRLASENGVSLSSGLLNREGRYLWQGFEGFLQTYDAIGRVVRKPDDLHLLASQYLTRCAAEGTAYVEFMLSPSHSIQNGIPYNEQVSAIARASVEAKQSFGIESRLIVTCVRHRGPDEALELAETVASNPHPLVVGFGLTGNERLFDVDEFSGAFLVAREVGLGLTAHAGEWTSARSVLRSVEELCLTRVGHGIKAAEDPGILNELSAQRIGFEVCLSSNIALGAHPHFEDHPLARLILAGCKISLATDDPAFFGTSPAEEYRIARNRLGLSPTQLRQISIDAVEMAFCDALTKTDILKRMNSAS